MGSRGRRDGSEKQDSRLAMWDLHLLICDGTCINAYRGDIEAGETRQVNRAKRSIAIKAAQRPNPSQRRLKKKSDN